ncbi:hypothetical protein ACFLYF_05270 [Chloroflexota bacterium]
MITTVTTSTVTTVTATIGLGLMLGLVAVVTLVVFLCAKELASINTGISNGGSRGFLMRSFNLGIVPLVIVFGVTVVIKVMEVLAWI